MRWSLRRLLVAVLVGLPLLSLLLNALAWLRYGIDLPFYDDWRGYANGQIDSLSPKYLLRPVNDTMAPIGFALDALAQRWLDGHSIVYQLLSMLAVLGALLALQWSLLRRALGDPLAAAACFVFTLLMLQPGSYWGRENLAYHQALPVVFLLAALWITLHAAWRAPWRIAAVFGLGLLAGFSYISGAFGTLAAGSGFLIAAWFGRGGAPGRRLLGTGVALFLAGAFSAITQFVRAVLPVAGAALRSEAPMALPNQPEFWLFYLGKLGRSLLLPADWPAFSIPAVLVACVATAAAFWWLLRELRRSGEGPVAQVAMVLVPLTALVFTYLMLVAAGRTTLRPVDVNGLEEIFNFGFQRFHFFWATLLWPWVAAAAVVAVRHVRERRGGQAPGWLRPASAAALALAVAAMLGQGALAHARHYAEAAEFRHDTIACLQQQLQAGDAIFCPEFNLRDFRRAYVHARAIQASFVRYFPLLPVTLGTKQPRPWFDLDRDRGWVRTRGVVPGQRLAFRAVEDPAFEVAIADDSASSCAVLDITARLTVERPDFAQLYFRPWGSSNFDEAHSRRFALQAGTNIVYFRLESGDGFESGFRLDPVRARQEFTLSDLEVQCRLRDPRFIGAGLYSVRNNAIAVKHLNIARVPDSRDRYRAADDPQMLVTLGDPETLAACALLRVVVKMQVGQADRAQVFFRKRGTEGFTEPDSQVVDVPASREVREVVFEHESPDGFEDVIRFDPVMKSQELQLWDLNVTCHRRVRPPLQK